MFKNITTQNYGEVERQNQRGCYFNEILRRCALEMAFRNGRLAYHKLSRTAGRKEGSQGVSSKSKKAMTISHGPLIMFAL